MSAAQKKPQPGMGLRTRAQINKMFQKSSKDFMMSWWNEPREVQQRPFPDPHEFLIFFRSDNGEPPEVWMEISDEYPDDPTIVYADSAGDCLSCTAGRFQQDDSWDETYEGILDEIMRRQAAGQY